MSTPPGNAFAMDVADVFSFSDGRTVFLGKVTGGPPLIKKCICSLWVDGRCVQEIEIEGEMLPAPRGATAGLRSVGSSAKITSDNLKPSQGRVRLVSKA